MNLGDLDQKDLVVLPMVTGARPRPRPSPSVHFTEDINIKEFAEMIECKVKTFETLLQVKNDDALCMRGPGPNALFHSVYQHGEKGTEENGLNHEYRSVFGLLPKPKQFSRYELSLIPDSIQLKTIKLRRKQAILSKAKKIPLTPLKYKNAMMHIMKPFMPKKVEEQNLVPNRTIVALVRIYQTFGRNSKGRLPDDICFKQEIVMLGLNTLAQLRDLIHCNADDVMAMELSENPHQRAAKAKDVYKSGFFFINDTFYNDMRDPKNIDYSENIVKWSKENGIPNFRTSTMETTKLEDLIIRLGFPYVYQHQGNCQHLFTISDMRLLSGIDSRISSDYPYVKCRFKKKPMTCFACVHIPACWIVTDSPRIPFSPAYFCERCFFSYNYIKGKKVCDFKAYKSTGPIYSGSS